MITRGSCIVRARSERSQRISNQYFVNVSLDSSSKNDSSLAKGIGYAGGFLVSAKLETRYIKPSIFYPEEDVVGEFSWLTVMDGHPPRVTSRRLPHGRASRRRDQPLFSFLETNSPTHLDDDSTYAYRTVDSYAATISCLTYSFIF